MATIITLLLTAFVIAAARAVAPDSSHVSNPTSKLGIWEGRWTYNERDYETPYSHTHTNSGTCDCNWAPNRGFMVCDYLNSNPGNGVPGNDLGVYSYSAAARTFARLAVFKDSKPFAERVTVNGTTWVTSADIPYKGAVLILRNVHVFSSDGKQADAITEISADKGKTWTTMSRFKAVKVDPNTFH